MGGCWRSRRPSSLKYGRLLETLNLQLLYSCSGDHHSCGYDLLGQGRRQDHYSPSAGHYLSAASSDHIPATYSGPKPCYVYVYFAYVLSPSDGKAFVFMFSLFPMFSCLVWVTKVLLLPSLALARPIRLLAMLLRCLVSERFRIDRWGSQHVSSAVNGECAVPGTQGISPPTPSLNAPQRSDYNIPTMRRHLAQSHFE